MLGIHVHFSKDEQRLAGYQTHFPFLFTHGLPSQLHFSAAPKVRCEHETNV